MQVWGVLQQLQHLAGVLALIGLGPQGTHRGAAAGVEDALLQSGGIGQPTDHAAEGIHLVHQLALGRTANGRVAGLPSDAVQIEAKQRRAQSEPGGRERRLTAGMATAHHDQLEPLDELRGWRGIRGGGEGHGVESRLRCRGSGDLGAWALPLQGSRNQHGAGWVSANGKSAPSETRARGRSAEAIAALWAGFRETPQGCGFEV